MYGPDAEFGILGTYVGTGAPARSGAATLRTRFESSRSQNTRDNSLAQQPEA